MSPPKEALVVPTVDEVTQASNEEISTSVDQLVSAESPFYPGKASHDARDADHSDHETEHRRWYNRIPFGKHSKTIHHGHTANEDDDRSNASISDQSSLNAKHGSHRFSKLARELATGLDANSPKDAKKVARRIFEALSPNTAALLKASAQRVVVDEELIDMAKYGFSASLSLQNFGNRNLEACGSMRFSHALLRHHDHSTSPSFCYDGRSGKGVCSF